MLRKVYLVPTALVLCWVAAQSPAQSSAPPAASAPASATATAPARSPQETLREYIRLQRQLADLFKGGQHEKAAAVCREVIALAPKRPDGYYNLACALARMGKGEEALDALADAIRNGYIDSQHMLADEDLASLREADRFAAMLKEVQANEAKHFAGAEMAGFRTLAARPEGGLRYRLRLSNEATKERSHRLIVWLHPSGGSMNETAEAMAPMLARHGFALLVFTQKNFLGWAEGEDAQVTATLKAMEGVEGLDVRRPILMGFSAGGQQALFMWQNDPGAFGGLILDAAYPFDTAAYMRGQVKVMPLPQDDAVKRVPIFVLVGEKDGGSTLWRELRPRWLKAGVPLTVHVVPGQGHGWLMDKQRTALLEEWLAAVAAGKLPAQADDAASGPATKALTQPASSSAADVAPRDNTHRHPIAFPLTI